MLSAKTVGCEIGDFNHSRDFPPRVLVCGFNVLTKKLVEYFPVSPQQFPFTIIVDKNQSHLWLVFLLLQKRTHINRI